ncbi:MAG: DUF1707 domain-containing protein [Trebonia sp.]
MVTGPNEGAAAAAGHLRAAHADREHVIDRLKTAFVAGQLSKDELDARAGRAFTARTYGELAALTADIPAGPPDSRPPHRAAPRRTGPARTPGARNAAIASAGSLIGAFVLFWQGVHLDDHKSLTFFGWAFYALLLALMLAAGAVVELKRSRRQRPPRPRQPGRIPPGQRPGGTGRDLSPPGPRADQTSADLRPHRRRADRPRPYGPGVRLPRGASSAPSTA